MEGGREGERETENREKRRDSYSHSTAHAGIITILTAVSAPGVVPQSGQFILQPCPHGCLQHLSSLAGLLQMFVGFANLLQLLLQLKKEIEVGKGRGRENGDEREKSLTTLAGTYPH